MGWNTCPPLVEDVDYGGDYGRLGAGGVWEPSVPSSQLCNEPKTALKVLIKTQKTKPRMSFVRTGYLRNIMSWNLCRSLLASLTYHRY